MPIFPPLGRLRQEDQPELHSENLPKTNTKHKTKQKKLWGTED
jgi:hypothetical protein